MRDSIVNYLAYDSMGVPPTIELSTNLSFDAVEEGKVMRVTADVNDDVQVRNVEFYIDGILTATDGNFPFEMKFITPLISTVPQFSLQARASDTGGNATWTDEISIGLLPDTTPPTSLGTAPFDGIKLSGAGSIAISFDEAINPGSVNANTFFLTNYGADELLGTADDFQINGSYDLRNQGRQVVFLPENDLEKAFYHVTATTGITDLAGNPVASLIEFDFEINDLANEAEKGSPADPFMPSANIGQLVTVEGGGFIPGGTLDFPTRNSSGTVSTRAVAFSSVAADGSFAMLPVPADADTGVIPLPDGSDYFLQIVPTVTVIEGGGPGDGVILRGSGFIEGFITVHFGAESVIDQGTSGIDGVNVSASPTPNDWLQTAVPENGTLPYVVETTGGRSGRLADVLNIDTVSTFGTPADTAEASANVGQTVTFQGARYVEGETKVVLEAMNSSGSPYITTVDTDSVSEDGTMLTFTVPPEARAGLASIINGGIGQKLQIVPTVRSISGGKGRFTTIRGTGFIEGFTTVTFGAVEVVDGGPSGIDGINVSASPLPNDWMQLGVPENGTLPYRVVTEGGSSGRLTDVSSIPATSTFGTPADPAEASANVAQVVTINGDGFSEGITKVTLEAMDSSGIPYITTVSADSVAPDGTSLTFTVPSEARAGVASILNGGFGRLLQIVPTVTSISGGKGRFSTIRGSGFIEGFTTVTFGPVEVVDGGPSGVDGINVSASPFPNDWMQLGVPSEATLPYRIVTEGGSSGLEDDLTNVTATAAIGTPLDSEEASANTGQVVTLAGRGFVENLTKVALEAMDSSGIPYITTTDPISINPEGTSLTFEVPPEVRAGPISLLNGGASIPLQVVPTITSVSNATPGLSSIVRGSGFIEGFITVRFGTIDVVDGGPSGIDGVNVSASPNPNDWLQVTVPGGGSSPARIITEGGTSNAGSP
jgi:hypothetical protein